MRDELGGRSGAGWLFRSYCRSSSLLLPQAPQVPQAQSRWYLRQTCAQVLLLFEASERRDRRCDCRGTCQHSRHAMPCHRLHCRRLECARYWHLRQTCAHVPLQATRGATTSAHAHLSSAKCLMCECQFRYL